MAQCEGTTKSGKRCRLDARPGSRFCHLHDKAEEETGTGEAEAAADEATATDLTELILTGIAAAGIFLIFRSFKWFPKF